MRTDLSSRWYSGLRASPPTSTLPSAHRWRALLSACLLFGAGSGSAVHAATEIDVSTLVNLSLDELGAVEITSVSRHPENRNEVASAVFVLSADDLRRYGATTVPEALRLVPGVHVGRIDANKWAISARGFNDRFANKLLVLIDGRSVYSPLFSGVFWDAQSLPLAEIERIEVIRGPGATMWGSNAVNGVINIITSDSRDTQGGVTRVVGGVEDRGMAALRYGGRLGATGTYRFDVSGLNRRGEGDDTPLAPDDSWKLGRGSLRLDLSPTPLDDVSLHVSGHAGSVTDRWRVLSVEPLGTGTEVIPQSYGGLGLSARWQHRYSATGDVMISASMESEDRNIDPVVHDERVAFDLEGMTRFAVARTTWASLGVAGRYIDGNIAGSRHILFVPRSEDVAHYSGFAHLEHAAVAGRLRTSVGVKFERNDYSGVEVQPNVRALWRTSESGSVWGAVSRAMRTPSRAETSLDMIREVIPAGPGSPFGDDLVVRLVANPRARSEELMAYELGLRNRYGSAVRIDVSAYHNVYRRLRTIMAGAPTPVTDAADPYLELTYEFQNSASGHATGGEFEGEWVLSPRFRLLASAGIGLMEITDPAAVPGRERAYDPGLNPEFQAVIRMQSQPLKPVELDLALRHVGALSAVDIPAYTALDARLGLPLGRRWNVGIVGQNLFDAAHFEFVDRWLAAESRPVGRNFYLTASFTFREPR